MPVVAYPDVSSWLHSGEIAGALQVVKGLVAFGINVVVGDEPRAWIPCKSRIECIVTPRGGYWTLVQSGRQGKLPVVWLHTSLATAWAAVHVVKRHGGRIEGIASRGRSTSLK
jgi:hypothetical protein